MGFFPFPEQTQKAQYNQPDLHVGKRYPHQAKPLPRREVPTPVAHLPCAQGVLSTYETVSAALALCGGLKKALRSRWPQG